MRFAHGLAIAFAREQMTRDAGVEQTGPVGGGRRAQLVEQAAAFRLGDQPQVQDPVPVPDLVDRAAGGNSETGIDDPIVNGNLP